jgi:hypothetical protein
VVRNEGQKARPNGRQLRVRVWQGIVIENRHQMEGYQGKVEKILLPIEIIIMF